jgi:hypothetical protein
VNKKTKPAITLPGTVEKSIPSPYASEKGEISVDSVDPLYKEIRIENTLEDPAGKEVTLKPGAQVKITIEAEPQATNPKKPVESKTDTASFSKEPESSH